MSKSVKRKRVEESKPISKKRKVSTSHKQDNSLLPTVRGDALKWKQASLPDRLEDAEGFYGLEEIDDVEIIKDEETGLFSFRPRNAQDVGEESDGASVAEEWTGFVEDKPANLQKIPSETAVVKDKKVIKDADANDRKQSKPATMGNHAVSGKGTGPDVETDIHFGPLDSFGDQTKEEARVETKDWDDLDLSPDLLEALSGLGFATPTPIQKAAIPSILEGRDVIGKAVTGSGKTLAFGVPILESWIQTKAHQTKTEAGVPIAFILAPTRELAHQLTQHLTDLCKTLEKSPRIVTVTGGLSVIKQQRQLETADIIVGTPGRLWEVINSSHGLIDKLKQIKFLVIDEADRLLSEGHFKEVEEILDVLNRQTIDEEGEERKVISSVYQRQTLVFSATFHRGLQQKLASKQKWHPNNDQELLTNTQSLDYLLRKLKFQSKVKPTFVDANPTSQMSENLTESILECGAMQKDLNLYALLLLHQHEHRKLSHLQNENSVSRTLVFTNSISTVKRLVPLLNTLTVPSSIVLPLHSSMPQKSRLRSLERFTAPPDKSLTSAILIATDVAARGLDIKGIDTIIHYHVPRAADAYVHRSGRTARSFSSGRSILICSPDEVSGVTRLISKVHSDKTNTTKGTKASKAKPIQPIYLPASLAAQLAHRVSLAQKITSSTLDTSKTKSETSFLRTAAEELGVDYSSDDFSSLTTKMKRGRGGGREKKKVENVKRTEEGETRRLRGELKEEMASRRVDFGDGEGVRGRYLAGGGIDVERLLREKDGLAR